MVEISDINPIGKINMGSIGTVLLIFFLAIFIIGLIGVMIWIYLSRKQLKYTIPLHKKIGNQVIKVAVYKAKDFKISKAGDKLWYVPKLKKYIPCGTLQTAPNEYTYFEREDGEWINISYPDIDEEMKKAKVKYVASDMRSQRIAISNILDARFKGKQSWWEKYGAMLTQIIFYFITCLCLVVIFWQWGGIVESTNTLVDRIALLQSDKCPAQQGVVPAIALFLIKPFKKKRK
jgi:hypothetical protein